MTLKGDKAALKATKKVVAAIKTARYFKNDSTSMKKLQLKSLSIPKTTKADKNSLLIQDDDMENDILSDRRSLKKRTLKRGLKDCNLLPNMTMVHVSPPICDSSNLGGLELASQSED